MIGSNSSFEGNNASNKGETPALNSDPEYQRLLIAYQHAEWDECNRIVNTLLHKYPEDAHLLQFKEDIEIQLALHVKDLDAAQASHMIFIRKIVVSSALILVALIASIMAIRWIIGSYQPTVKPTAVVNTTQDSEMLATLESQANVFLDTGKTDMAFDVIKQIQDINPQYPGLAKLSERANNLSKVDSMYQEAVNDIKANELEKALPILKQIDAQAPQYKDVSYQIKQIEKQIQIAKLLTDAEQAYTEERWADVTSAYEQVLDIDPTISSPKIEEQLFVSYYKSIIAILNNPKTTVADIDKAEDYYRKAVSLVPQSKSFAKERGDLQQLMVDLLIFRYRQTASSLLQGQYSSEDAVNKAVNYLKKASNLNAQNAELKSELDKAQLYLLAFQRFDQMDWDGAIESLLKLSNFDKDYANGMVKQLLYEAYAARGKRYFTVGFYSDARKDFEAAEVIAWERQSNLFQLLEAQLNMGYTLGKMQKYKDAASYFSYAMKTITAESRATDPNFVNSINSAQALLDSGRYYDSYMLYMDALKKVDNLYTYQKISFRQGDSLAYIANAYSSSIQAILERNGLTDTVVLKVDQDLVIPALR